jgi:hypothetical protein
MILRKQIFDIGIVMEFVIAGGIKSDLLLIQIKPENQGISSEILKSMD